MSQKDNDICETCLGHMSDFSMKKIMLDEIKEYRQRNYPKELCDLAEIQIMLFYQKNDDKTMMHRTAIINSLWFSMMSDSSAALSYAI